MTALTTTASSLATDDWTARLRSLIDLELAEKSVDTKRAYEGDVRDLAGWLKLVDTMAVAQAFAENGQAKTNLMLREYIVHLKTRIGSAAIRRRIAAIKMLVKLLRMSGVVTWTVDVTLPKRRSLPDTTGVSTEEVNRLLTVAEQQTPAKAARDVAMIRLACTAGMRRFELWKLQLEDFDLEHGRVSIAGKDREKDDADILPIPEGTVAALRRWIKHRGDAPGPMLTVLCKRRTALTRSAVYYLVTTLGTKAGLTLHPHQLRHFFGTTMLSEGVPLRDVQKLMRHKDARTTEVYDDNRRVRDSAGPRKIDALLKREGY